MISDGQNARSGLQQDLVCQRQAGTLIAVPEKLPARTPAEGRQRLFCCRSIGGKDCGQLCPDSRFLRHRRRVVRTGDGHASRAQLAPLQSLVAGDEAVELADILQGHIFVNRANQEAPSVAHVENGLNIVDLYAGDVDAFQNGLCLWECDGAVFHLHAAVDVFIPLLFCKEAALLRCQVVSVSVGHSASPSFEPSA